jgi:hypothetical protein
MFIGAARPLSYSGLAVAAASLQAGLPALWAVMTVETRGCGFLPDRRPQILFERHIFHKRTNGKFDAGFPDLSAPTAGGYGAGGAFQHDRLMRAVRLDRRAALESTSWGLGQVMGFNAASAGFPDAETMAAAMCESEDRQFQAMAAFITKNGLQKHLQQGDWATFARHYNGPDFQKNQYDTKLAGAHAKFVAGPLPSLSVRAAQLYLIYLGYKPGPVDGWSGRNTREAVIEFQKAKGLPGTGQIDDATLRRLEAEVAALHA